MKLHRSIVTLAAACLIFALFIIPVFALEQNEISVSLYWTNQMLFQGDTATVRISIKSNSAEQLLIYYIGVHFDWMPADGFYGYDLSKNPVLIPAQGSYIFEPMSIQIPINVTVGEHNYFVGIEGRQGSTTFFSWDSPTSTVQIRHFSEKFYSLLMEQVQNKLNESIYAKYESAEARSLLQQAQKEIAAAQPLALAGNWQEALPRLYNASDLLDQARETEQLYIEQKTGPQALLFYGAVIAVAIIVVISMVLLVKRRKQRHINAETEQSIEISQEPSEESYEE